MRRNVFRTGDRIKVSGEESKDYEFGVWEGTLAGVSESGRLILTDIINPTELEVYAETIELVTKTTKKSTKKGKA